MRKRILVVDDEKEIREIYRRALSDEGFETATAGSTIEAHELIKRVAVDCVLLDIRMPFVGGCSLFEAIRLFHKDIKVIVNSVFAVEEQKKIIRGAHGYYDKSQGLDTLVSLIRKTLGVATKTRESLLAPEEYCLAAAR